jgi:hypothetical protein
MVVPVARSNHMNRLAFLQRRYKAVALLALAVLLGVYVLLRAGWWRAVLPTSGEVEDMRVALNPAPQWGIAAIPQFTLPPEYVPVVLEALEPAERKEYPAQWDQETIGLITIRTKAGKSMEVSFCVGAKSPVCFQVNGRRFTRGGEYRPVLVTPDYDVYLHESLNLSVIIRLISVEVSTGRKNSALEEYISNMRRSKGEGKLGTVLETP